MKISHKGIEDDGSNNVSVSRNITAYRGVSSKYRRIRTATLAGSGSVSITEPGFYYVPATGSWATWGGYFTGSVPSASDFPGAKLVLVDSYREFDWCLTGSSPDSASGAVFSLPHGVSASHQMAGTRIDISPSGSIVLISDSYRWCISAGTGSYTLGGLGDTGTDT